MVGDLDLDEEITDWDGVLLARYLAGWNVDVPDTLIFDIDGDGEITDWDGVMFDRTLAGWSVNTEVGTKLAFNITYLNTKGATNTNPNSLQYGNVETNLLEISAPHYTFDGWYVDNQKYTSIPANQNGDLSLTAKWTPIEYNISYNNTKGASNSNPTHYNIESSTIALSNISVEGYIFDGWYNGNTKVTSIPVRSSGNIVLTAKWTPCDYSITYNNTKGAVNNNITGFNTDSDTITLLDLQKEGYTFDGWYNNGVKVTKITKGTVGNITLTASWTKIEYNITYLNVNGAANNNPSHYTVESSDISLQNISLNGYNFLGWYDENGQVSSIPKGSTGDIVLTAKWENLYSIIYTNTKSSTNNNPNSYTEKDGVIELSDLTKTGYVFNGWYDGETKVTHIDCSEKKDITLTANWTANTYRVYFRGEGGTTHSSVVATYGEAMPELQGIPVRRGFEFLGYYSSDGYKYYNADLSSAKKWNLPANTTLYAKWADIGYQVTTKKSDYSTIYYELQNYSEHYFIAEKTGTYYLQIDDTNAYCSGSTYQSSGAWTYFHKTMVIIYDKDDVEYNIDTVKGVDSGKIYYDYDRPYFYNAAHVNKEDDGDLFVYHNSEFMFSTADDSVFEISIPVEKGRSYKIIAYTEMRKSESLLVGDSFPVSTHKNDCSKNNIKYRVLTEDGKFVQIYSTDSLHNITYTNTKDVNNPNETRCFENTEFNLLELSKEGYVFDGWFLDGEKVSVLSNITNDIVLEAKWTPIKYTATFYVDNQIVGTTTFSVEDDILTECPPLPQKEHYSSAWDYTLALNDISVYVKYTPIDYKIIYKDIDCCTNDGNPKQYTIETEIQLYAPKNSVREFLGWFDENDKLVTVIPRGSFGDIEITAKWGDYINYTIHFKDDKYGLIVDDIIYNFESETIVLPELKDQTDYYFAGWYRGDVKITEIPNHSSGDIELTAKWASKSITYGSASVYNISMSGGSAYVQSVSESKSWDSSRKAWLVGVTVTVRINPRTSATYEVRLGALDFGTVSFQGYGSYETQTRTTTKYLSPGNY